MSQIDRLFVADPVRHDRRGHHWHFAEGALREAAQRSLESRFFVAQAAAGRALPDGNFHPVFRHGLYRTVSGAPAETVEEDVAQGSDAIRDDLLAATAFDPDASTLVVVPTATLRNLAGFLKWRGATQSTAPLSFLFHDILPHGTDLSTGPGSAIATDIRERLSQQGGRVLVGATNEALARDLASAFGRDVPVLPQPHWYDLAEPTAEPVYRPPGRGILTIAFLGELRREKGGHLLPEIAELVRRTGYRMRLVVQAGFAEPTLGEPLHALQKHGDVDLIGRHLSNAEFVRFIQDSPLMLLPYDRAQYRARISGPFSFAAAWGRPCIVPDGTWMAEQIESGRAAGVVYAGSTPQAIADGVGRAIESLTRLTREANQRATAWRLDNGTALFDRLTGWAAHAA